MLTIDSDFNSAGPHSAYVEEMPAWVVLSSLGKGSKGEVFLVRDREGNRLALKKMYPKESVSAELACYLFDEEGVRHSAREEWEASQHLRYPLFVKIYEFHPGKETYLLMEWVDGKTLDEVPYASLDPKIALNLLLEAIEGLQFAFNEGWIHHDLGSDNLMVDNSYHLKFIDLEGFDKLTDDEDMSLEEYRDQMIFVLERFISKGIFTKEQKEKLDTIFKAACEEGPWDGPVNSDSGPIFISFLEKIKTQILSFS